MIFHYYRVKGPPIKNIPVKITIAFKPRSAGLERNRNLHIQCVTEHPRSRANNFPRDLDNKVASEEKIR